MSRSMFGAQPVSKRPSAAAHSFAAATREKMSNVYYAADDAPKQRRAFDHSVPEPPKSRHRSTQATQQRQCGNTAAAVQYLVGAVGWGTVSFRTLQFVYLHFCCQHGCTAGYCRHGSRAALTALAARRQQGDQLLYPDATGADGPRGVATPRAGAPGRTGRGEPPHAPPQPNRAPSTATATRPTAAGGIHPHPHSHPHPHPHPTPTPHLKPSSLWLSGNTAKEKAFLAQQQFAPRHFLAL
jgi:hypothetical protein